MLTYLGKFRSSKQRRLASQLCDSCEEHVGAPSAVYQSLVMSMVCSQLDYGNATLCGLPDYQYRRLQSVLNTAARSIFSLRQSDHVTPVIIELHWLNAEILVWWKLDV